jgi:bla regulator protein BlaR1
VGRAVPVEVAGRLPAAGQALAATAPPVELSILFAIWIAGALASAAVVVRRYRSDRAFCGRGCDAAGDVLAIADDAARRIGLRRRPRIVVHDGMAIPATIGIHDPIVVLPRALVCAAARQDVEHVLLHELAHVRRCDAIRAVSVLAVQILYWFHPLIGIARRRLAGLREIACDRAVVEVASSRDDYRRTLIRLAQPLVHPPPDFVAGAGLFARCSELVVRLELLASPRRTSAAARAGAVLLCMSAFAAMAIGDASAIARVAPADATVDVQGCLRLRYAVYAALAEEAAQKGQR